MGDTTSTTAACSAQSATRRQSPPLSIVQHFVNEQESSFLASLNTLKQMVCTISGVTPSYLMGSGSGENSSMKKASNEH